MLLVFSRPLGKPHLQKQVRNDSEAASGSGRLFVGIPRVRLLLISACREFVLLNPLPPSWGFLLFFSPIIPEFQAVFHPSSPYKQAFVLENAGFIPP